MKLHELKETQTAALTVRVDQQLSDMFLEPPFSGYEHDQVWEDISEVPEPLALLIYVVTPIEQDYRGMSAGPLRQMYETEPEIAFYVGKRSGKLYQQDLLNIPNAVSMVEMSPKQLMSLVQKHATQDVRPGKGH